MYVLQIIHFFSRGPNKYTRNWEDEDAYGKTGGTPGRTNTRRFQKNNEDFPSLGSSKVSIMKHISLMILLIIASIIWLFMYLITFLNFYRTLQLK